ncbi:hypothetical protein ABRQ22_14995 [Cellulosimicrobium sp. ES-005]|uniref:Transposase n=1 Tax=Cellulosimicrobium sp. ES-005 TaxID=3163031 RepID=A0AAU8FY18_9MICO
MVAGDGPSPRLVLAVVRGIASDDRTLTSALMRGGLEYRGWGHDRHLLASIFDAINQNTLATGSWRKGKAPKIAPWPRPTAKKRRKKHHTVAELYAAMKTKKG